MLERKFSKGMTLALAAAALFATTVCAADTTADKDVSSKVHCGGVNSCRGRSECHTPKNLCAGLNACKGQGWIAMTRQACEEQKGKVLNQQ